MASAMVARHDESVPITDSDPRSPLQAMNANVVPPTPKLTRDPDGFLHRSIQDLFSLAQRTIVVTGGGRGIGLALAFAIAEAGGSVAILDITQEPHPHYLELVKRFPEQQFKIYKYVERNELIALCANPSPRTDVTNYGLLQKSVDQVVEDFGRIDGLLVDTQHQLLSTHLTADSIPA